MSRNAVSVLRDHMSRVPDEQDYDFKCELLHDDSDVATEANGDIQEFDIPAEILDALGVEGIDYGDAGVTLKVYDVPGTRVSQLMLRVRDYD